jgi:hypothetical protein
MIRLFCFVLAVVASPFKSKVRLEAENAVLRHQLNVVRRSLPGRVRLTNHNRWFLIQLYRWFPSILQVLTIIQPVQLVLTGGTALNAVGNMRLLGHFDEVYYQRRFGRVARLHLWVPPMPNDTGIRFGRRLYGSVSGRRRSGRTSPTSVLLRSSTD